VTGGWAGKILEVDLTSGRLTCRASEAYTQTSLGGRSLAARLGWDEIPPGIDAFDPENRMIVAAGPFTGTLAPTSGRTIMAGLSPRVYPRPWYTHSTLGGWFGPALKYAGFDALVIHGRSEAPVSVEIQDGQARLVEASALWGLGTRQTQLLLKDRLGREAQILAIGPAGENLVRFATVQHAEENAAAHSGFGAVWGSKNLKAIAVLGSGGVRVADPAGLLREVRQVGKFKRAPCGGGLDRAGARKRRPVCSQACPFNCQVGVYGEAEDGRLIPGYCIGAHLLSEENGLRLTRYTGGGLEVPAGANFSRRQESGLHQKCNDLGLDLWLRLVMQPWLVACLQHGVRAIRGFPIAPEEAAWFDAFVDDLAYRRGLGDLFAEDLRRAMDALEGELPQALIHLGRALEFAYGFPAHREGRFWDEEPLPFWVVSAMMHISESRDPTIGAHQSSLMLADFMLEDREAALRQFRKLSLKAVGQPDAFEPTFEGKAPLAVWSQDQHMLIDSLPLCDFAFPQLARPIETGEVWQEVEDFAGDLDLDLRLIEAVLGTSMTRTEVTALSRRAFTLERLMLARAGRTRKMEEALAPHFKLPCRADGTQIDAAGFSKILDEYYTARGWDLALGWPEEAALRGLGLEEAVPELQELRLAYLA
jgi:aldehyde:ferredoxin oxidoreductase